MIDNIGTQEDENINESDSSALVDHKVDPREIVEEFNGWTLFRRSKVPLAPVRHYCSLIDEHYSKHKYTVCAHLSNLFNTYSVMYGRTGPNFWDVDKWSTSPHNNKISRSQLKKPKQPSKKRQQE